MISIQYGYTVEHPKSHNRRYLRSAVKYRMKLKKKFGIHKSQVAYDKDLGIQGVDNASEE